MRNNRIINMRAPRKDKDAATKKYVDELGKIDPSNYAIDFHNRRISNIADPIYIDDAVTRKYVDYRYTEIVKFNKAQVGNDFIYNSVTGKEHVGATINKFFIPRGTTIMGMYCIFWDNRLKNSEEKRISIELTGIPYPFKGIDRILDGIRYHINFTIDSGDSVVYLDNLDIEFSSNLTKISISTRDEVDSGISLYLFTKNNLSSHQSDIKPYSKIEELASASE